MWLNVITNRALNQRFCRQICTLETATLNYDLNKSLRDGHLINAHYLFNQNPTSRDVVSWNIIISGYVKTNNLHNARQLFDEMPQRDIVTWNTLLSGFQKNQDCQFTYQSYLQLQRSGLRPNQYTFSILISSILGSFYYILIPQIHAQIVVLGYCSNVFVGSALIRGYTNLGDHSALCCVFDDILEKSVSVWNALILGHMELGFTFDAQRAFDAMPVKDVVTWTTMIDGYSKNKQVKRAGNIFNMMGEKNVVSWTAMISGYVRVGKYVNALEVFPVMMRSGTRPNQHTFSSILAACAEHSDLVIGKQVHGSVVKHGVIDDVVLSTALVDMYAKCADIEAATSVFESMPEKNTASWNTIIGSYARHGLSRRALNEFDRMICSGLKPDRITFVNVLSACAHGGEVVKGERIFLDMEKTYEIPAEQEHYACMVNLYGKAGFLDKAKNLIECMPFEPDVVVWGALLGACGLHSDVLMSNDAAYAMLNLEKNSPDAYSLLLKLQGEQGLWSSLAHLKNLMDEKNIKKHNAGSWIS